MLLKVIVWLALTQDTSMMHNKALVCVGSQMRLFVLFAGWHFE